MKFSIVALAMAAVGAGALTTVSAPCGTDCPTTIPGKTITRTKAMPTDTAPCPSLIVSTIPGAGNGTKPMVPNNPGGASPSPTAFTGGAGQVGVSLGAAVAAGVALFTL